MSADGSVETVLVATTAAVGADDAPAVAARMPLAGGGDARRPDPLPPGGLPVRVTLAAAAATVAARRATFRFVPADGSA